MKHNGRLTLLAAVFLISMISGLCVTVTPAAASTTTYTGNGNPRPILERANNATIGSVSVNNTALNLGLPSGGWEGYQLGTTFTNIVRNADYVANGQFTGSQNPWSFSKYPSSTSYILGSYTAFPPSGTKTGSNYIKLNGNTTSQTYLGNMNFTDSSYWTGSRSNLQGYGTFASGLTSTGSQEWRENGTYYNPSYWTRTGSARVYCDQYFTYSGDPQPIYASLSYKFHISQWTYMSSGFMNVSIILTRYYLGGNVNNTLFVYTASGTTSMPSTPTAVDITSYITSAGTYRIRLYAYIRLNVPGYRTSYAAVDWDDVGVYIRYGKYLPGSYARWSETWDFGKYVLNSGTLSFRYWTNLTSLFPSPDSYVSAWVGANQYNVVAFSSITTGIWRTATVSVPVSAFNASAQVTVRVGVSMGSNLQINSGTNPVFYFDNITFFIRYKATPESIKLGIIDDTYSTRWDATGTAGSGSLTIVPSGTWNGPSALFYFVTNGTNGKVGYNSSVVTFSYTSTMYSSRWRSTSSATFSVSDDTRTNWYCSYSTPSSISGYQNYNTTIYVPADWLNTAYQGGISQVKFAGIVITDYNAIIINSTTGIIKIPASVFAPNPPQYLLEIWLYSANHIGPSQLRTLLFTQVYDNTFMGWRNASAYAPGNLTRLVCYIRDGSGGIPSRVNLTSATIRIYNESGGFYKPKVWTVSPFSNGTFYVTLNPWNGTTSPYYQNVTYNDLGGSHGISWYFAVNWTNGYESANGIARFNTSSVKSYLTPTILTSPKQPYTGTYSDGFTLVAMYTNSQNSTGIMGATVTWRWIDQYNVSLPMVMTPGIRGNYTATVDSLHAYQHFAPQGTWIQVNASRNGFVFQSIQARVVVRDIATTGSAPGFKVPYEAYAWNNTVYTSLTYYDADHGMQGISGAVLYVNRTCSNNTVIGSSGIRWWYKNPTGGNYQLFFNATALTPSGTTKWSFNVTVTKSHYSGASFNLNGFYVRDRATTRTPTEPYLSIAKPWGDSAVFLITYCDSDANGAAIFGATATSTWTSVTGLPYTVTPLSNGTYRFALSVGGLAPQTISFSFGFSKPRWTAITSISAQVIIRAIDTDLSSPSEIIQVWGDPITSVLTYKDIDHNSNIAIASWDTVQVYDKVTGDNYTSMITFPITPYLSGSWILNIASSLNVSVYTLRIHAYVSTANGYYVDQWRDLTLYVQPIPTRLDQQSETVLTVVWSDPGKIVVLYSDRVKGTPILGAGVGVLVNPEDIITWESYENGTGIYTIFLDTTNATITTPSFYQLDILFSRANCAPASISYITIGSDKPPLYISPIHTQISITPPQSITKGSPANYTILFWDTSHDRPVFNANIALVGVDPSHYSISELGNGYYSIILQTDWISENQEIPFTVTASKTHYDPQQVLVSFRLTGGLSLMTMIMIGGGSGGAVVVALLGYVMYRRAKIPFVIKRIDQSIKLIGKGEMPLPVPMRTRSQLIKGIFETKLAIMSREKLEEAGGKKKKGSKQIEISQEDMAPQPIQKGTEPPGEAAESDVDLVAKELEKLEGREEKKPSDEAELIKREIEELEKGSKKKRKSESG